MEENSNPNEFDFEASEFDVDICLVSVEYNGTIARVVWREKVLFEGTVAEAAVLEVTLHQMLKDTNTDTSATLIGEAL